MPVAASELVLLWKASELVLQDTGNCREADERALQGVKLVLASDRLYATRFCAH